MTGQQDFDVLVTAEEAWPAFERLVLGAKRSVSAAFRIFDLRTKLRSDEARAVGTDWFDLLGHVLGKGVTIRLVVSDFDPVMATELHEIAWTTKRQAEALREAAQASDEQFSVTVALHPARAGFLPRLTFLPLVLRRRAEKLRSLSRDRLNRQAMRLRVERVPMLHTVSHHQKLAVIDGETVYIGGLDLNERRYDSKDHDRPAAQTWSDVQVVIRGPEAQEAERHLEEFLQVTAGRKPPSDLKHVRRTISAPRKVQFPFLSPRTCLSEIETAHLEAFRAARHLIYIETQYFRSRPLAEALSRAAAENPGLAAIIILPALPEEVAFSDDISLPDRYGLALQKEALHILQEGLGVRLTLATPVQPRLAPREGKGVLCGSPVIHVHSKVLIRDADYALVGSANLNGRSLRWDTEAAVELTRAERVDLLRRKVTDHWWREHGPDLLGDPAEQQALWQKRIAENCLRLPENRRGFLVPHDPDSLADTAQALPVVTDDIV